MTITIENEFGNNIQIPFGVQVWDFIQRKNLECLIEMKNVQCTQIVNVDNESDVSKSDMRCRELDCCNCIWFELHYKERWQYYKRYVKCKKEI